MPIKDSVINAKMIGKIFFKPILFSDPGRARFSVSKNLKQAPPVLVHLQNYQKDEGLPLYALLEWAI